MSRQVVLFLLMYFMAVSVNAMDFYHFNNSNEQRKYDTITHNLRCLVCQNQSIADSDAALARDLREIIYVKIQKGESNKKINQYLKARYGDYILYDTPINYKTYFLWMLPFVLFFYMCYLMLRR